LNINLGQAHINPTCDTSIPNLRDDNVDLLAKIDELNVSLDSLRTENEKLIAVGDHN
jgi:hypothetical protein